MKAASKKAKKLLKSKQARCVSVFYQRTVSYLADILHYFSASRLIHMACIPQVKLIVSGKQFPRYYLPNYAAFLVCHVALQNEGYL